MKYCRSSAAAGYCHNTAIQRRAFPATEVFATPSCGLGLRCVELIQGRSIIAEYTGEGQKQWRWRW